MKKKVLIITYYWPPSGGPGVQRVLKFAKYLPEFGWEPIILTVKNGEYPAIDESLLKDIPAGYRVYKTKTLEPNFLYKKFTGMKSEEKIPVANLAQKNIGWKKKISNWIRLNFFIPDAKIGWISYAVKKGKEIIKTEKPDIIFSSSPPPTVHLIARKLAKWSGIKWIADFRDPWTKIHYLQDQKILTISKRINQYLEKQVIADCDSSICVSNNFVQLLTEKHQSKFHIITNGFDNDKKIRINKNPEKFVILYIGGLTWNRYYPGFFDIYVKIFEEQQINPDSIELQLTGSIDPAILNDLNGKLKNIKNVHIQDYVPHDKAIEYMNNADLLLLFLEKTQGYEGHIPGKIFEYISTNNPVLGIGGIESGESADILRKTGIGQIFNYNNNEGIRKFLQKKYIDWENKEKNKISTRIISQYSRRSLTKELTEVFNKI